MNRAKIGLLGLYVELYDRAVPDARERVNSFYDQIASELENHGVDVVRHQICRLRREFDAAVSAFESAEVDCLVTLHLAYSPSLECADVLASTKLPLVVLDTTPTYDYSPAQDPGEQLYNHGIHGVQDMCSVLARRGRDFFVEAGHWEKSDVLDRVAGLARAAHAASRMRKARIGLIGEPFRGMGDFAVPQGVLKRTIGMEVFPLPSSRIGSTVPSPDDPAVEAEITADKAAFDASGIADDILRPTEQAGLAVRRWIEQKDLSGFTMNFLSFDKSFPIPVAPFLEASKSMARGIGYAGEGDVLTAALVSSLLSVYPDTSFVEMFCPDWKNESIYLSHMGEVNPRLLADKPVLLEKPWPWSDSGKPVVAVGRLRGGDAVLVDIAPGRGDSYTLICAAVQMLDVPGEDKMTGGIRGWFRPSTPIADFLEEYSRVGGTHHLALVYGGSVDEICAFGRMMGWKTVVSGQCTGVSGP